jgi:hypothetical protein
VILLWLLGCHRRVGYPERGFPCDDQGMVLRTLKVLAQKRFLSKQRDAGDKRLVHLKPAARGRRLVVRATPAKRLAGGFGELSGQEAGDTVVALRRLLCTTRQANRLKSFATCNSARFNRRQAICVA